MPRKILLVSCSKSKRQSKRPIPARELYTGTLIKLALEYARLSGLQPFILSAKYGIIPADQPIATYNKKLTEPYDGPWPDGSGEYIGSQLYFGKAPKRFKRTLTARKQGEQLHELKALVARLHQNRRGTLGLS